MRGWFIDAIPLPGKMTNVAYDWQSLLQIRLCKSQNPKESDKKKLLGRISPSYQIFIY